MTFTIPKRTIVENADVEFDVREGGEKIGTLQVSKGSLEWRDANDRKGYKLGWGAFRKFVLEKRTEKEQRARKRAQKATR